MNNEIWADIPGYENYYQINSFGEVKSMARKIKTKSGGFYIKKERILKQGKTKGGYFSVELFKNKIGESKYIHRLICLSLLDNINDKPCINHINGIKTDNRIENLKWVSYSENMEHAFKTGLCSKSGVIGERNGQSKLKKDQVICIKNMLSIGELSQREIGEMFGVRKETISKISRRETWKHINI